MILKNIFFNPLKEIIIWIEFFINLFPGQIGKIIRLTWFSIRTFRFLVIRIDTNCKFIKINNIIVRIRHRSVQARAPLRMDVPISPPA